MSTFEIGDVVTCSSLRTGSSLYSQAMVICLEPFTLLSEDGDMRWSTKTADECTYKEKASARALVKAYYRILLDKFFGGLGAKKFSQIVEAVRIQYTLRGEVNGLITLQTASPSLLLYAKDCYSDNVNSWTWVGDKSKAFLVQESDITKVISAYPDIKFNPITMKNHALA